MKYFIDDDGKTDAKRKKKQHVVCFEEIQNKKKRCETNTIMNRLTQICYFDTEICANLTRTVSVAQIFHFDSFMQIGHWLKFL